VSNSNRGGELYDDTCRLEKTKEIGGLSKAAAILLVLNINGHRSRKEAAT